jgi:anti-sigma regulatory factor (Ser/Thr protein kinase)
MRSVAKSLTESYPALPGSVAEARRRLSSFAADAGSDEEQIEAVRLASSEALTNAVLHAYRGEEGRIHVTAAVVEDELWVLIADDGCGLEPAPDRPGLGLGLGLIAQLSDHLAIAPRANGGTEVRMRFNLVGAQPAQSSETHGRARREHRSVVRGTV